MSYQDTVQVYLGELAESIAVAHNTGETTPELSYRPVLDRFIRNLAAFYSREADIIFEPKQQGHVGRPDWRIYNTNSLGLYGFVEAKALDPEHTIQIEEYRAQVSKYLGSSRYVILTDGLDFVFFDAENSGNPERYCLIDKPFEYEQWTHANIDMSVDVRFRTFFRAPESRRCSETRLVHELAIRTRELSRCVSVLSEAPQNSGVSEEENRTINILHEIRATLQSHHDPVLGAPKVFADFVSQVLCFGLLYAHRVVGVETMEPRERYDAIGRFWTDAVYASHTDRLVPFKALVQMLESELTSSGNFPGQVRCWYDDARRLLAHVQLRDRQRTLPDYHILYETFLKEFDPETRIDFGAYYTPPELASFTVSMANAVIESRFDGRSLYERDNVIIDPCCGTGTFIEQLVRHTPNERVAHLVGFEILPAPYALAHYRRAMFDAQELPEHRVDIFLTNTLGDELAFGGDHQAASVLRDELHKARSCAQSPIVLVIGNPPSSDSFGPHSTGPAFSTIDRLLNDFRPPACERRARQNTQKQIRNDFMKFLRLASDKVMASDMGALALVLPSAFATHPSYRHARSWLLTNFCEFWVLDFDRDLRTGVRSSSVFESQQGRMLLIATHTRGALPTSAGSIHYASITDKTRGQKMEFLSEERTRENYMRVFEVHDMDQETSSFRPTRNSHDLNLYARFWAIHPQSPRGPQPEERAIFARHCSGTKLAPTALFVHPRQPMLQRRNQAVGDMTNSYEDLRRQWFSGQSKPPAERKLVPEVRERIQTAAGDDSLYCSYAFRPFVSMKLFLDHELLGLLSQLGGGGTRMRPEVVSAYSHPETIGIAIAPSPIDLADDLHRFATFCWNMPDNDLCRRGNAHVFCNQFPENKPAGRREWDATPKNNVTDLLLREVMGILPGATPTDIVFYVYAVLCSSTLLEAFADAYFTASGTEDIPRVPIVRCRETMQFLIDNGAALAQLEHPSSAHGLQEWVSALEGAFVAPFELRKAVINEAGGEISLYAEGREPTLVLRGIPHGLLGMTVSGYDVIKQWLKFHSHAYTRTQFDQGYFTELLQLLSRLSKQTEIISEIDDVMVRIIDGSVELL
jgi:hypothetical protein